MNKFGNVSLDTQVDELCEKLNTIKTTSYSGSYYNYINNCKFKNNCECKNNEIKIEIQ